MRAPPVSSTLLGVPGPAWGGVCVFLSLLFLVVWPSRVKPVGFAFTVLRWGHSVVWVLIAAWFFVQSWTPHVGATANLLLLLAGLAYAVFVVTLIAASPRRV